MSMLSPSVLALSLALPLLPSAFSLPLDGYDQNNNPQALLEQVTAVVTETHITTAVVAEYMTTTITAPAPTTTDSSDSVLFLPPNAPAPVSPAAAAAADDDDFDPGVATNPNDPGVPQDAVRRPLIMAYYPAWIADAFPPERVDFARYDWVDFAFAVPDAQLRLTWDGSPGAPDLLRRLVAAAHAKGKKVKISVGGWTGSAHFSSAVSNDQNRHTLVANTVALYRQFNVDGIDIDWEYPGQPGNTGNELASADTANFFSFLTLLRASLPAGAKITAATQTVPFAGPDGRPIADARQFASVLDWVLLMNYDVWGSSSNPGPNAPLSNACRNATQPSASADAAVRAWTAAGFPAAQLVLGVPSYGYTSRSTATRLRQRQSDPSSYDPSDPSSDPSDPSIPVYQQPQLPPPQDAAAHRVLNDDDGTAADGQVQFRSLVRQGVLCAVPGAPGAYTGCGGFAREWDACSSTPFLRGARAGQIVTYDDAQSLGMKAQFARSSGLRGVNMFDVHGDTDASELVDAVRRGLGVA